MQERVDTADERENALRLKLLDEKQESNMKGKLILEYKKCFIELKKEYTQETMKLQEKHESEIKVLRDALNRNE